MMRIVFLGTPEFAVPVLDKLIECGHEIAAVISQPDREKDKKGRILPTPVKQYAVEHGLKCLQFEKLSREVDELKKLSPDVMITAAYGQLLTEQVLSVPKLGVLNVHASVLPKYRGSSPIQSAILSGDEETGVTIMKTEIGMDTGDIVAIRRLPILPQDTAGTLSDKLSLLGAELLAEILPDYGAGKITPVPQRHDLATRCKKISKADGVIDWSRPAHEIVCKVRAYNPWPIAYTYLDGVPLKIYQASVVNETVGKAGEIKVSGNTMTVACGSGSVSLCKIQLPGKKALPIDEFLRGCKPADKTVLG